MYPKKEQVQFDNTSSKNKTAMSVRVDLHVKSLDAVLLIFQTDWLANVTPEGMSFLVLLKQPFYRRDGKNTSVLETNNYHSIRSNA